MSEEEIRYRTNLSDNDVKNWLNRAYKLEPIIKKDKEELDKMKSLIETGFGIDYEKPNVQTSPKSQAPFENRVDRLVEYTEEFEEKLKEQIEIKREIRDKIDKLDDVFERNVLNLRHCYFMQWVDIALELSYSKRQCFRLYNQAIKSIKEYL